MPKISVIIPVYNVEKYLSRCLDSLLCQTYEDFEIFLIDDCSTDQSGLICEEYARKDKRIKFIKREQNGGLSAARNTALKNIKGEFVCFVDSDDYLAKDYLSTLYEIIVKNNADMVHCAYYEVIDDEEKPTNFNGEEIVCSGEDGFDYLYGKGDRNKLNMTVWNKMFRVSALDGLTFEEGYKSEDCIFTSSAVLKANTIVLSDIPLYYYRTRSGSIMAEMRNDIKKLIRIHVLAYRKVAENTREFNKRVQLLADARLASFYVSAIKNKMLKEDQTLKKMLKEDKKRFKFRKNKNIPLIKRIVLSLWG